MLHRRLKPSDKDRNKLDVVRLLPDPYYDVDTTEEKGTTVVVNGLKSGFGGISISTYSPGHCHNSNRYTREESIIPIYKNFEKIGGKNIQRWHCYKCERDLLPKMFDVAEDDPPHHGIVYPVDECDLLDVLEDDSGIKRQGRFPYIREMEWTFCCNLLQINEEKLIKLKANGEPSHFSDFDDSDVQFVLGVADSIRNTTEFDDESIELNDIVEFIFKNCSYTTKLVELLGYLSERYLEVLLQTVLQYQYQTEFSDEAIHCEDIVSIINDAKVKLKT